MSYNNTTLKGVIKDKVKTQKNEEITAEQIMLVDETGQMIGQIATLEALLIAEGKGLDLIEVQQQEIPICKIVNKGKEKYRRQRTMKKSHNHQKKMKEIRIGLSTAIHDLQTKTSQISKFLSHGHVVKLTMKLKGREISSREQIIEEKMKTVLNMIDCPYSQEGSIKKGNGFWSVALSPLKK